MSSQYPIFEDNQVLTSSQLNQLIEYLDLQNRLTRSCLIGMGIACGLELEHDKTGKPIITITEGMGITSEGFLIKLCPVDKVCITTQYKDYVLPKGSFYEPFQDKDDNKQDVGLYELLEADYKVEPEDKVSDLTNDFLKDKVVLLFLECLDKDLKSCLGKSCDELGIERIFTLRKLLISLDDLKKVKDRTNGGMQDTHFLKKFDLKNISLPRIFFDRINTVHYFPFAYKYIEAINTVYDPLRKLLDETYNVYEIILQDCYEGNPFQSAIIDEAFKKLTEYLKGGLIKPTWWGVQYVYDFFKDLILAYQEFKDCAYDLMIQCCPDMTRFPRHLMLGKAIEAQKDKCKLDEFRHAFTQPPIYNNQKYLLAKTISLHKRIVLMIEHFSFNRLQEFEKTERKITPSCEKKSVLSHRSIPFYYNSKVKSKFEKLENLELEWNYDRKRKECQIAEDKTKALNLSYDNNTMKKEFISPLTTPLNYDIDALNFLRIEGFQGKDIKEVIPELEKIRYQSNIDFDVKFAYFGDTIPNTNLLECFYQDLQPSYEIWRSKLLYFLGSFARFTNTSRFLSTGKVSGKTTGKMAAEEAVDAEPLHEEMKMMRNMNVGLNKENWASALEEVHHKSKQVNMKEWTRGENNASSFSTTVSDNPSIGGLHSQITNCIAAIRKNTPEDIRRFKMEAWLPAYKCPLNVYVELIKLMASRIPRGYGNTAVNTYLKLYCALHEILRNLFIYPYLDIRITYNTIQNKLNQFVKLNEFSRFEKYHNGLEHQAGLEQGQTLVLLLQAEYSDRYIKKLVELVKQFLDANNDAPFNIDEVLSFPKEHFGKVVGDFTLPYKCCDPCNEIRHEVAQLDPIALPICEAVPIRKTTNGEVSTNDQSGFEYLTLKEKIFHTVYEPERYRAKLTSNPNYGVADLPFYPFEYDETKNTQIFTYQVDINKVMAAAANTESAYLTDVIDYEILHAQTNEVIDSSTITILIPIIFKIDNQPIGFKGMVYTQTDVAGKVPIQGAEVWVNVNQTRVDDVTGDDGMYTLNDPILVNGTYTVHVAALGYFSEVIRNVKLDNEITNLDIQMRPIPNLELGRESRILFENLGVTDNSMKAISIIEEYRSSSDTYKKVIEASIEEDKDNARSLMAVEKAISIFAKDESLTSDRLNETYARNRDALLEEINNTNSRTEKRTRTNALKVLTNSYMDRLLLKESKSLSPESVKTVKESSELISRSGISMKSNIEKWSRRKEKVVGKTVASRITKNFKVS